MAPGGGRIRGWAAAALLGCLLVPAQAGAVKPFSGEKPTERDRTMSVEVTGRLVVDFHADPATCAAAAMCGVSGRTTWTPARTGDLDVQQSVGVKHRYYWGQLYLDNIFEPNAVTRTLVQREGADGSRHTCQDTVTELRSVWFLWSSVRERLPVALNSYDTSDFLLRTRCAGPVGADVVSRLTRRLVRGSTAMRGGMHVDLSGRRSFASNGLVGTVRSTIALRTGRAHRDDTDGPERGTTRYRAVRVTYRVAAVDGSLGVTFNGGSGPGICTRYDACGMSGGVEVTPGASEGEAVIAAVAPASRPRKDLLAALGLSATGDPEGVQSEGRIEWSSPHGVAASHLEHADGGSCAAHMPVKAGTASIRFTRGVARAEITSEDDGVDALRSRCGGPLIDDVDARLATGTMPAHVFAKETVVLSLSRGTSLAAGPFLGETTSTLSLTLTHLGPPEQFTFSG